MRRLPWIWFDHRTDLPSWLLRGIAQVIVEWSVLERELEEAIRLLMDTNTRVGRIVANKMNARTRVALINNFIQTWVYYEKFEPRLISEFAKFSRHLTEVLEVKRNTLAHGVWGRRKGKWYVLRVTGKAETPELAPDMTHLSRAVLPRSELITAKTLRSTTREIVAASKKIEKFCDRFAAALAPLQNKRPEYTRRRSRYHRRS